MQTRKFVQELLVTALISLTVFGPFIGDLRSDSCFIIYLTCSFLILVAHERLGIILPTYWSCTALAVVVIPFVYRGVPTLLETSALLVLLRAWHVGLLTSRSGYATDVSLYRSNGCLTATLTIIGLAADCFTTFTVMHLLGYPNVSAALMAAISPAPSPEVALPLFDFVTSSCTRAIAHLKITGETETKRSRLGAMNEEMESMLKVFRTSAFPLISITIAAFCSVASGVNPKGLMGVKLLDVSGWESMAFNALVGLGVALAFSVLFYIVGRLLVPRDVSPHWMASLLVCTASFAMFFVGAYAPVAAALAAIGACLCLRWSTGFSAESSSILSMIWPYTSLLYYSTFAYVVVGYFTLHRTKVVENLWKMSLGSLVASLTKLTLLTLVSRNFKKSWLSSLTLALSLCSKGTVQIALCALLPLKVGLNDYGSFVVTVFDLQLFVLLNYLIISPLIYVATRAIVAWMWR